MAWFPEEPDGIVHVIERETPREVKFYTDASNIVKYEHTISPAPPGWLMSIADSASGVTVSFPELFGIFPIQYIDYATAENEIIRVTAWDDLPTSGIDIVSFRPDQTITAYSFTLEVIATDNQAATISNSWKIDIDNDWLVERANFLERMNAGT